MVTLNAGKLIVFPTVGAAWPHWATATTSGLIGGLLGLTLCRMAFVLWRDYDIIRLQAELIERVANQDRVKEQTRLAEEKVAGMKGANLRAVANGEPKAWDHGV